MRLPEGPRQTHAFFPNGYKIKKQCCFVMRYIVTVHTIAVLIDYQNQLNYANFKGKLSILKFPLQI